MTGKERRAYASTYEKQHARFESKYRMQMYRSILTQINEFINDVRAYGLNEARQRLNHQQINRSVFNTVKDIYTTSGLFFANQTASDLKRYARKKADGRLSRNQDWINRILNHFGTRLLDGAVIQITESTRNDIRNVLNTGIEQGLGVDELISRLRSPAMARHRAEMIVRTEIGKAANIGRQVAAEDFDFETQKEWITSNDAFVRDAHAEVDGMVVDMDENFIVDGEELNGPCDPSGSPSNIINCRCTYAVIPKRSNGRLIPKG